MIEFWDSLDPDAHNEYERLLASGEIDENGCRPIDKCSDAEIYEEAMAYMLFNEYHKLEVSADGDGWNEPFSADYFCDCDEAFDRFNIGWVQTDRARSHEPTIIEVTREWVKHVRENQA